MKAKAAQIEKSSTLAVVSMVYSPLARRRSENKPKLVIRTSFMCQQRVNFSKNYAISNGRQTANCAAQRESICLTFIHLAAHLSAFYETVPTKSPA
jgi:hypothetical protein